jgi:ubiquinone/menaquinone biosynthesis C-methylase UbiE
MNKGLKKESETNANFWRRWWHSRSHDISSDCELDRITSFQDARTQELAEQQLLAFVNPKASDFVFDAGCGSGIDISRLSSRVRAIIGLDQAEGMIHRCKKRVVKENINNVGLMVGSVTDIGLKSNTFDKIICMSVLHYLNEEECDAAFKELVRISKDGAVIVFHVKNLSSLYLSTLGFAKKIKHLFTNNVIEEFYRTFKWYEVRLAELGVKIIDYDSVNKFVLDFLPKQMWHLLQEIEMSYYGNRFLRKYGADLKIKAQIEKRQSINA